jgi:hypothetical protein
MKIVCLLHSLLKKIQEWVAVSASGREPTLEISDKVRVNLEKFVWSSREKNSERKKQR